MDRPFDPVHSPRFCRPTAAGVLKNINQSEAQIGLDPKVQLLVGNQVFMLGNDDVAGEELWVSDGTTAGTQLVKDICPGPASSQIKNMVVSGGKVFFTATDGNQGKQLWISDGTLGGTKAVTTSTLISTKSEFRAVHPYKTGVLFVTSDYPAYKTYFWYSDGSTTGTRLLRETRYSSQWQPRQLGATSTYGYAILPGESNSLELWRTTGTKASTVKVTDVYGDWILGPLGNTLLFTNGYTLKKTDGTAKGTQDVKTLTSYINSNSLPKEPMVVVNGKGYFITPNSSTAAEIWSTDGTEAGTQKVSEWAGANLPQNQAPQFLSVMGQKLVAIFHDRGTSSYGGSVW